MKKLLFLSLLLFSAGYAKAGLPSFTSNATVLSSAAVQDVQVIPTGYRMYFTSGSYYVMSATSTDGVNWGVESGVRLSTTAAYLDVSSITAFTLYYNSTRPTNPYIAYYVGINSSGQYYLLRAFSTDGLTFTKDATYSRSYNSGNGYIGPLKTLIVDSNNMILYYIADNSGTNVSSNYRANYLSSQDKGTSFYSDTSLFPATTAYALAVSTLTDGRVRLFLASPATSSTNSYSVISAISNNLGYGFTSETSPRYSTTTSQNITSMAIARSTESWRWSLYTTMGTLNSTGTVSNAVTWSPSIASVSPVKVYQTDPNATLSVLGEIFSSSGAFAATLTNSGGNIPVTSVVRNSDILLTMTANTNGAALGTYDLTLTDAFGKSVVYTSALTMDFLPGSVKMYDGVFRPLRGESCRGDVTIYAGGDINATVYTTNGAIVKTLYNGPTASATVSIPWDGKTGSGNYAASGLYVIRFTGPKLDTLQKVVLIK